MTFKPRVSVKFLQSEIETIVEARRMYSARPIDNLVGVHWQPGIEKLEQIEHYAVEDVATLMEFGFSRQELEYLWHIVFEATSHPEEWFVTKANMLHEQITSLMSLMDDKTPKPIYYV